MSLGIYTFFYEIEDRTIVNNSIDVNTKQPQTTLNTIISDRTIVNNSIDVNTKQPKTTLNTIISESIPYSSPKQTDNKKAKTKTDIKEKSSKIFSNKNYIVSETKGVTDNTKANEIKKEPAKSNKSFKTKKSLADEPLKISQSTSVSNYKTKKSDDNNILLIKYDGVHLRESPVHLANSLICLNNGEQCTVISKGQSPVFKRLDEKENINVKDYWYKVKCKKKIGWIFGYYTSKQMDNE